MYFTLLVYLIAAVLLFPGNNINACWLTKLELNWLHYGEAFYAAIYLKPFKKKKTPFIRTMTSVLLFFTVSIM